jgi:hypothetical protein
MSELQSDDKIAVTIAYTEEADGDIFPSILRHFREGGNLQTNWLI